MAERGVSHTALSADTLVKLLDSARQDIRAYRTLYLAAWAFTPGVYTIVCKHPGPQSSGDYWVHSALLFFLYVGTVVLALGVWRLMPAGKFNERWRNDVNLVSGVQGAVEATSCDDARSILVKAVVDAGLVQKQVAATRTILALGTLLLLLAMMVLSFDSMLRHGD